MEKNNSSFIFKAIIFIVIIIFMFNGIATIVVQSIFLGSFNLTYLFSFVPIIFWLIIIFAVVSSFKKQKNIFKNTNWGTDKSSEQKITIPADFFEQGEPHNGLNYSEGLFSSGDDTKVLYYENGKPVYGKKEY